MNSAPPSGPWKGYYLYGAAGSKHHMRLDLAFGANGRIDGGGTDDIAPFTISGHFDSSTSQATWIKAYQGMHTVHYSGIYCQKAICGDWTLQGATGGFWIWPASLSESEFGEALLGLELETSPAGADEVKPAPRMARSWRLQRLPA